MRNNHKALNWHFTLMAHVESTSVTGRPCDGPLAVVEINFFYDELFKSVWTENMFMPSMRGVQDVMRKSFIILSYIQN